MVMVMVDGGNGGAGVSGLACGGGGDLDSGGGSNDGAGGCGAARGVMHHRALATHITVTPLQHPGNTL